MAMGNPLSMDIFLDIYMGNHPELRDPEHHGIMEIRRSSKS